MTLLEDHRIDGTEDLGLDVLFREARRRRHRRWFLGLVVVTTLIVGVAAATLTIGSGGPPSTADNATAHPQTPASPIAGLLGVHLDILSAQTQVSARLAGGNQKAGLRRASPGIAPPLALARESYVVGTALGNLVSVSDNLRSVLHTWATSDGQYVAPAGNPADVWLSNPYEQPSRAQEFDEYGRPVGPAVALPYGSIVDGQSGSFLVLQGPPPSQELELWDPESQKLVAALGPWDQEAASSNDLAWTKGNLLHLEETASRATIDIDGPAEDWARSVSFSPNGQQLAIVWAPEPGRFATSTEISEESEVTLIDVGPGNLQTVPDSSGALGPLTWAPDGTYLFFAKSLGGSPRIESYAIAVDRSTTLNISKLHLPADFSAATGGIIAW